VKCREQVAREASPTAAIIDAQSVKSAEGASIDPHGYDAGKKVKAKSGLRDYGITVTLY
jgi:putative transposase